MLASIPVRIVVHTVDIGLLGRGDLDLLDREAFVRCAGDLGARVGSLADSTGDTLILWKRSAFLALMASKDPYIANRPSTKYRPLLTLHSIGAQEAGEVQVAILLKATEGQILEIITLLFFLLAMVVRVGRGIEGWVVGPALGSYVSKT